MSPTWNACTHPSSVTSLLNRSEPHHFHPPLLTCLWIKTRDHNSSNVSKKKTTWHCGKKQAGIFRLLVLLCLPRQREAKSSQARTQTTSFSSKLVQITIFSWLVLLFLLLFTPSLVSLCARTSWQQVKRGKIQTPVWYLSFLLLLMINLLWSQVD